MKYGSLSLLFGWLSPMLGRVSFCYTLLFLTGTDSRVRSWPVMVFIFLQVAINCVGIIVFYTQCGKDLDAFWNVEKQLRYNEYCWDPKIQTRYGYFMGAFNTTTDAYLTVLPAILIHHSSLSTRKKIGVAALLCLSLLAMVASVIKTYEARALSEVTDYTYNLAIYVIALAIELNIVIITASIPLLRPLFTPLPSSQPKPSPSRHHIPLNSISSSDHQQDALDKTLSRIHTAKFLPFERVESCCEEREGREGILITREVHVRFESLDAPHVHAALVGLIQGEMANPGLVRT